MHVSVPPSRTPRLLVALAIGFLSGGLCCWYQVAFDRGAGDLTFARAGALALLQGVNPYTLLSPPGGLPLFYPLPAFLLAMPSVLLPPESAAGVFFGLSSAVLAFGLSRSGWWRLLFFLAFPYWQALQVVQWSPIMCAVVLYPMLLPVITIKPNIGLVAAVATPWRWVAVGLTGLLLVVSLVLQPTWPWEWFAVLGGHPNIIPLLTPLGPFLVLALFYWRTALGRLLLGLAVVPQRFFYDQLLLWLIPYSPRTMLALVTASWLTYLGWFFWPAGDALWVVGGEFLPALGLLFLQSRTGSNRNAVQPPTAQTEGLR